MPFLRTIVGSSITSILLVTMSGCSLFQSISVAHKLPPLEKKSDSFVRRPPRRDLIELQVSFIDRHATDPLIGDDLWADIDQIGAVRPHVRDLLMQNGFQIGQVGSIPPEALQTLFATTKASRFGGGKSVIIPVQSGGESEIQTSGFFEELDTQVEANGTSNIKSFNQARCVFRVRADRIQDGWVKLTFLPEIHYGELRSRHTATNEGWRFKDKQRIDPLYELQFEVSLAIGETVVVAAVGDLNKLGNAFLTAHVGTGIKRLMVVRLVRMHKLEAVSTRR